VDIERENTNIGNHLLDIIGETPDDSEISELLLKRYADRGNSEEKGVTEYTEMRKADNFKPSTTIDTVERNLDGISNRMGGLKYCSGCDKVFKGMVCPQSHEDTYHSSDIPDVHIDHAIIQATEALANLSEKDDPGAGERMLLTLKWQTEDTGGPLKLVLNHSALKSEDNTRITDISERAKKMVKILEAATLKPLDSISRQLDSITKKLKLDTKGNSRLIPSEQIKLSIELSALDQLLDRVTHHVDKSLRKKIRVNIGLLIEKIESGPAGEDLRKLSGPKSPTTPDESPPVLAEQVSSGAEKIIKIVGEGNCLYLSVATAINAHGKTGEIVQAGVEEAEALRNETVKHIDENWEYYESHARLAVTETSAPQNRAPAPLSDPEKTKILDDIRNNKLVGAWEMEIVALASMHNSAIAVRYVAGADERRWRYEPKGPPEKHVGQDINLIFEGVGADGHYDVLLVNK